jgi:nucleotide-binding universal stress UspA family protein
MEWWFPAQALCAGALSGAGDAFTVELIDPAKEALMRENTTYNKILLLTDLTEKSQPALSYARAMASYYNAHLVILHVLPLPETHPASLELQAGETRKAREIRHRLDAMGEALRKDGISVQPRLLRGPVAKDTILRHIRSAKPDLIIQGSAGIADLRRLFVGSIAEGIFRSTETPVLTVPKAVKPFTDTSLRFERILLATDFGTNARTTAIYALSLAQEFGAHVSLCHVHAPDSKSTWSAGELSTFFDTELHKLIAPSARDWCEPRCAVEFGQAAETILRLAERERSDLIVIGAHSLGPLGTRGRPGTVFRIVANATCPVLSILSGKRSEAEQPKETVEFIAI